MFDYQSTSRLRRKVKKKLVLIKGMVQREFTKSLTNLAEMDLKSKLTKGKCKSTENLVDDLDEPTKLKHSHSDNELQEQLVLNACAEDESSSQVRKISSKLKRTGQQIQRYLVERYQELDGDLQFRQWKSIVTITLVKCIDLLPAESEKNLFVKFKLGSELYKSRTTQSHEWLEQFNLHIYDEDEQEVEITLWSKTKPNETLIIRSVLNLATLDFDKTHEIWHELEHEAGSLHLLVTISDCSETSSIFEDEDVYASTITTGYKWKTICENYRDVGLLTIKVIKAAGLAPVDLIGNSNPFCIVELGNSRCQTQPQHKTLSPEWNKIFKFKIKDINDILDLKVFDEYKDCSVDFLGRVVIPLLQIENGKQKWYALKDKRLRNRANGHFPQILIEANITWDPIRASITSLNPREEKYVRHESKFKSQILAKNITRVKKFITQLVENGKVIESFLESDSKPVSFGALLVWLCICYIFQLWMVPAAGLGIFALEFVKKQSLEKLTDPTTPSDIVCTKDPLKEDVFVRIQTVDIFDKLQTVPDITQSVQNAIGEIASAMERTKNLFNFTVPFLSFIAIVLLIMSTIVLYLFPLRILFMLFGVNKFLRRALGYMDAPNVSLFDLISRVPDDEMLTEFKEMGPIIHDLIRKSWNSPSNTSWYVDSLTEEFPNAHIENTQHAEKLNSSTFLY